MDYPEKLLKLGILYAFCFLNAIDFVQTLAFLRMGIEGNPVAVHQPYLWFPLKFVLTFGLPAGMYLLDLRLAKKEEDKGIISSLRSVVDFFYFIVLLADIFFLSVVLRNMSFLGGRLIP